MRLRHCDQDGDDGVPALTALRQDDVSTYFAAESVSERQAWRQIAFERDERRRGSVNEDADVLRETGGNEIDVDGGKRRRRSRDVRFHHHLEPQAEAPCIELLVTAGRNRPPQIEIEDTRELAWCGQCHQLAAVLESAVLNDAMKKLGLQLGNSVREVWRTDNTIDQPARTFALAECGVHASSTVILAA